MADGVSPESFPGGQTPQTEGGQSSQTGEVSNQLSGGQTPQTEGGQSHQGEVGPASEGSEMPEELSSLLKYPKEEIDWKEIYGFLQQNPNCLKDPESAHSLLTILASLGPKIPIKEDWQQEEQESKTAMSWRQKTKTPSKKYPTTFEKLPLPYQVLEFAVRHSPQPDEIRIPTTNEEFKLNYPFNQKDAVQTFYQNLGFVLPSQINEMLGSYEGYTRLTSEQLRQIATTLEDYLPEDLKDSLGDLFETAFENMGASSTNLLTFGEKLADLAYQLESLSSLDERQRERVRDMLTSMSIGYLTRLLLDNKIFPKELPSYDRAVESTLSSILNLTPKEFNTFVKFMKENGNRYYELQNYVGPELSSMLNGIKKRLGLDGVDALIIMFTKYNLGEKL